MNYYNQWQSYNCNPDTWQNNWTEQQLQPRNKFYNTINSLAKTVLNCGAGINADKNHLCVDVTPKFTRAAHRRGHDVNCASVLNLPFKDKAFDCVCCENLLIHLQPKQWMDALTEMKRCASKYVATFEPRWREETRYVIREHQYSADGMLCFYLNEYGTEEMVSFARGFCKFMQTAVNVEDDWQITVYQL